MKKIIRKSLKVIGIAIGCVIMAFIILASLSFMTLFIMEKQFYSNNEETEIVVDDKEKEFQQMLHAMTHSKVHAEVKWGLLEITDERIDEMLRTLDEENFVYEDLYREILNQWKEGDFSNAVEHHNEIWKLQGGKNTGKATRLLTPEEEKELENLYFNR